MPSKPLKAIKPMFASASSWKIRPGDLVQVITGKDRGKQGEVLSVARDQRFPRVFVSGVNMVTKHTRRQTQPGGEVVPGYAVRYEGPIHYSNVMLVDPETRKAVRVQYKYEDRPPYRKVRITRGHLASGCLVPWPKSRYDQSKKNTDIGDKDTRPEDAEAMTYNPEADFTLEVPSAHRWLREFEEKRALEREKRKLQARQNNQQQPRWRSTPKLFSSTRGYHTSRLAAPAAAAAAAVAVGDVQLQLNRCSLADDSSNSSGSQQQLPLLSSSSSLRLLIGCRGSSRHSSRDSAAWCGLAAVPYLL